MVFDHFGEQVDIHGGGSDLMFPHHEAEIFQSECCHEIKPFARHWMHNGMINIDGEKMSKSLGNFWTITEAIDAVGALVLRYALINAPYRQPIDFNQVLLDDARKNHARLIDSIMEAGGLETASAWKANDFLTEAEKKLVSGMNDDLNTRVAIAETQSVVRLLNRANATGDAGLSKSCVGWLSEFAGSVLGILPDSDFFACKMAEKDSKIASIVDEVQALIEKRDRARSAKNWAEADNIRDQLSGLGVTIQDTPDGTTWDYYES